MDDDRRQDGVVEGVSRRAFLRGGAAGAVATGFLPGALHAEEAADSVTGETVVGPGRVPVTLTVNGRDRKIEVEPRVTLLDALREQLDL